MPTEFDVSVELNIPRELLWRVRATRTFMQFLVENGALQRMDATDAVPSSACSSCDEDDEGMAKVDDDNDDDINETKKKDNKMKKNKKEKREYQRRQTYVPGDVVIPDMVKTVIDESYIEIGDDQTWDENKPYTQQSIIRPAILGDMILTKAQLSLHAHPDDETKCIHSLAGTVSASILFLGYYVEQAIVTNMKSFYDNYPTHIDDFVNMVVHKYGDGHRSSLRVAIDKMLVAEQKS